MPGSRTEIASSRQKNASSRRPAAAYNAARCRLRAGQAEAALAWSAKVTAGSIPEAETALVALDALRALGRWPEVVAAAVAYLDKYPAGARRAEV